MLLAKKKVLEITFEFGLSKTSTQANSGSIFFLTVRGKGGKNQTEEVLFIKCVCSGS